VERTLAAQPPIQPAGAAKAITITSKCVRFSVPPAMPKPSDEKIYARIIADICWGKENIHEKT
jgi:hypothetical protein